MRSSFVMNLPCCQTGEPLSTTIAGDTSRTRENLAVAKSVRRLLGLGILAGAAYAVWRAMAARSATDRR